MDKIITVLGYKNFITEMSDAPDCCRDILVSPLHSVHWSVRLWKKSGFCTITLVSFGT